MNDDEIIREVASWERAALRWRERVLRLFAVAVCLAVLGVALAVLAQVYLDRREIDRAAAEVRRREQEAAWQACLDALGLDTCDMVEERLAERCLGSGDSRSCLRDEVRP